MLKCMIKTLDNQTLHKRSGLSDFNFESQYRSFITEHSRDPYLDELKGVDSKPYLEKELGLKPVTDISHILEVTGTDSLESAIIQLNNTYRDKEIEIIPILDQAIIRINDRPNKELKESEIKEQNENINNTVFMNQTLTRLSNLYGINIKPVSQSELESEFWKSIPGASTSKGFVFNGDIYINTDLATVDTPLHEMLHLLFGSIRYSNPELYYSLVSTAEQFESAREISKLYPNRSQGDLLEEVFIENLARYMTGQENDLKNLNQESLYEISYNMNRVLDSTLMGNISVSEVRGKEYLSLKKLAEIVNSDLFTNKFSGSLHDAKLSRIMSNTKSDLLRKNELKQECE